VQVKGSVLLKISLSKKYFRALTIAATGFGGGMFGLWALKLSAGAFGTSALSDSAVGGVVAGLTALSSSLAAVAFFSGIDESEEATRKSAMIDPLTELFSKNGIIGLVEHHIEKRGKPNSSQFLIDVEIDRFKELNDVMGFAAGDEVIRQVGNRLEKLAGTIGNVGRFGGGEFGMIIETTGDQDEIRAVADHILETISGTYRINGGLSAITCSLGIVEIRTDSTVSETVRSANVALKQARLNGRGAWALFSQEMTVREEYRSWIEVELRSALKRGDFSLYYQPQVNIIDGSVLGYEALLRWKHPVRGYIPPLDFIQVAEENGFINTLGRWAILQACRDASTMDSHLTVSVNLSPMQFLNGDILRTVDEALRKTGLDPGRLELEVTESTLIEDRAKAAELFAGLAKLGTSIAIDDFGTGYSNLGYLADIPFKKLKIDKSFIDRIETDMHMAQIVSAIIALSRALGAIAVAEGVETERQETLLKAAGCNVVQGFLHGKPMPLGQLGERPDKLSLAS
jgi:diguanylate cyclase (GGDEF)-like protein